MVSLITLLYGLKWKVILNFFLLSFQISGDQQTNHTEKASDPNHVFPQSTEPQSEAKPTAYQGNQEQNNITYLKANANADTSVPQYGGGDENNNKGEDDGGSGTQEEEEDDGEGENLDPMEGSTSDDESEEDGSNNTPAYESALDDGDSQSSESSGSGESESDSEEDSENGSGGDENNKTPSSYRPRNADPKNEPQETTPTQINQKAPGGGTITNTGQQQTVNYNQPQVIGAVASQQQQSDSSNVGLNQQPNQTYWASNESETVYAEPTGQVNQTVVPAYDGVNNAAKNESLEEVMDELDPGIGPQTFTQPANASTAYTNGYYQTSNQSYYAQPQQQQLNQTFSAQQGNQTLNAFYASLAANQTQQLPLQQQQQQQVSQLHKLRIQINFK